MRPADPVSYTHLVRVPEGIFYVDCTGPEVRLTPWQGEADNRLVLLAGKGMQLRRTARTAVQWYNDYIDVYKRQHLRHVRLPR